MGKPNEVTRVVYIKKNGVTNEQGVRLTLAAVITNLLKRLDKTDGDEVEIRVRFTGGKIDDPSHEYEE